MKTAMLSVAAAAGLVLSSGTASAQWRGGGHGHGGYTEYHPGYFHNNHYHPGHLHTYSRPQVSYAQPFVVNPYNAGLYGQNPYSGYNRPTTNFNFGYNSTPFGNSYRGGFGRRW